MDGTTCATEYLTSADVARLANQRGDALTPAGVRLAAITLRLKTSAITGRGVRLFTIEAVEAFLQSRVTRRADRGA